MKFLNLNPKSIALVTIISMAGTNAGFAHEAPGYTDTIEGIYHHFDEIIMQDFKQTFKDSFSEHSTEKLNFTTKKMKDSEQVIQEFRKDLEIKECELRSTHQTDTALYAFITTLLKIADDLEKYFNIAYTTLTSGLTKKLKATAFATELTKVSKTIVTDENFKRIDGYLEQLQKIAQGAVSDKIDEIRSDIKKILQQHKAKSKDNAAALNMLRKRLPY